MVGNREMPYHYCSSTVLQNTLWGRFRVSVESLKLNGMHQLLVYAEDGTHLVEACIL
jgi:hypothetical protein